MELGFFIHALPCPPNREARPTRRNRPIFTLPNGCIDRNSTRRSSSPNSTSPEHARLHCTLQPVSGPRTTPTVFFVVDGRRPDSRSPRRRRARVAVLATQLGPNELGLPTERNQVPTSEPDDQKIVSLNAVRQRRTTTYSPATYR